VKDIREADVASEMVYTFVYNHHYGFLRKTMWKLNTKDVKEIFKAASEALTKLREVRCPLGNTGYKKMVQVDPDTASWGGLYDRVREIVRMMIIDVREAARSVLYSRGVEVE